MALEKVTQTEVEEEALKNYLLNDGIQFNNSLVEQNTSEPTDIRYNGINYQITIGDQEAIEARRRVTSKGKTFIGIRSFNASNIASQLLGKSLEKKSKSADSNTVLLIEVTSTGNIDWDDIKIEFNKYMLEHPELSSKWNQICAVFPEKNIWLKIEKT